MADQLRHEEYMKQMQMKEEWADVVEPAKDMANSPAHYADSGIETIDYIVDVLGEYEAISYCHGNIIKYTGSRLWKKGNPIEDAKKARWYMDKMIELLEKTEGVNW
jgi:hypothetical protein